MGNHSLLQEIFPSQGSQVSRIAGGFFIVCAEESPRIPEWVAYPFSVDLPDPGIELVSHVLQADCLPAELLGKMEVAL